jgi:hypothetical protein
MKYLAASVLSQTLFNILDSMQIKEILDKARQEQQDQIGRLWNMRQQLSADDFKELFMIRAGQAMTSRKIINPFAIDNDNREVINQLYFWLTRKECVMNSELGIIINGAYGCGKSVLMEAFCMVFNDITPSERGKVTVVHAIELAEQIKKVGVIPYARIPMLIHDLGREKWEMKDYGNSINPISDLLALRAEYGSMTFGTTNMTKEEFGTAYKAFITKRIFEHVNLLFLPGKDRRKDWSINQPKPK